MFSTFGKVEISQHSKAKNPWHNFCQIFAWDWDSQLITFIGIIGIKQINKLVAMSLWQLVVSEVIKFTNYS
jgi:hypothetical protein